MTVQPNETNMQYASILRSLADYIEMSESTVKLKLGVHFKIKNMPVVNIPVNKADKFAELLSSWVVNDLIRVVKEYQLVTGRTDGTELLAEFEKTASMLKGVDKG